MDKPQFHKLSWTKFVSDVHVLANHIQEKNLHLTKIVAISRGGLIIARILSDILNLPISHMTIASYSDFKKTNEPTITESTVSIYASDSILLIDELADTGKTFVRAISFLKHFAHKHIYTCALYKKPHSSFTPDFIAGTIDAWIIFPYEVRETYESFLKLYGSSEKALVEMKNLGFASWELSTVSHFT